MDFSDKLNDYYPWNNRNDISNQIVLCLDDNSGNGKFSLLYLINKLIDQKIKILLFSCIHSKSHYENILRKNAYSLVELENSNQLIIKEIVFNKSNVNNSQETSNNILEWIEKGMLYPNDLTNIEDKYTVIIDDLEAFDLLFTSRQEASLLIRRLCDAVNPSNKDVRIGKKHLHSFISYGRKCLNNLTYSFGNWSIETNEENANSQLVFDDDDIPALSEYLQYRCDTCIVVNPLSSGYTQDVHGSISITSNKLGIKKQLLLFKALDSGVKCQLIN